MNISEKRHSELYSAISDPIMAARIEIYGLDGLTKVQIDDRLYKLELAIYQRVKDALNLHKS